jgi:hypothetical protein
MDCKTVSEVPEQRDQPRAIAHDVRGVVQNNAHAVIASGEQQLGADAPTPGHGNS